MEILGGPLFGVAGAGESHGPAVVAIVFGCPSGLKLSRLQVQRYLDRRRPGGTKHATTRRESDQVAILSGVYSQQPESLLAGPKVALGLRDQVLETESYGQGFTTGEPIAAMVLSTSKKSADYAQFEGPQGEVRPGHTDLVKHFKSRGFVDIRGGGRSSYRSTIADVVGGSIARLYLEQTFQTRILSSIAQVGSAKASRTLAAHWESVRRRTGSHAVAAEEIDSVEAALDAAEIRTIDDTFAAEAVELIRQARVEGDSLGAAVEVAAVNPPPLAGEPLYQSLKLRLMGSLGGLHAVQSCEIGDGFDVVSRKGSENNDPIRSAGYQSNTHGGLIGGITTGMPLTLRVGFKPTSSISKPQASVDKSLRDIDFELRRGRHDPCVGVRAGITLESRLAIELLNAVLMHQAGRVHPEDFQLF